MSSINPNNIDGTYPIAGQDNDSQGFRDNFTNIKNNFTFAYDELTDLQSKVVLKSALSGGSISNDMAYAQLISPQLLKTVETKNDLGIQTGSFTISWADGHFQYYTTSGNTTLAFSNWPTSGYYTKLRLQITTDTTNRTVTLPAAVSVGLADIQGAAGQVITFPTAGVYLFELTTVDNGSTITIQDLLRNYDTVTTGASGAFTSLNVSGNVLATGLTVSGNINATTVTTTSGNLTLDPTGVYDVVLTNNTNLFVLDTTPSTSSGTGAVQVLGGVGVVGNLNVGSALSASGVTNSGAQIETGYQQVKPGANVAVTVNSNVNRVLLHPASSIISFGANVTLPNTQVDGTIISISSNVTISQLAVVTPWAGTTVSPYGNTASITAGTVSRFMFINADKIWYKIA